MSIFDYLDTLDRDHQDYNNSIIEIQMRLMFWIELLQENVVELEELLNI